MAQDNAVVMTGVRPRMSVCLGYRRLYRAAVPGAVSPARGRFPPDVGREAGAAPGCLPGRKVKRRAAMP